jgi:flagella basal body P-ring formation protein FlgA
MSLRTLHPLITEAARSGGAALTAAAVLTLWLLVSAGSAFPAERDGTSGDAQMAGAMTEAMDEILVRVLAAPEVKGETFTLGEVAEFDGFDVEGAATLAKVNLGRSPSPGRPTPLSEPLIRSRLAGLVQADRVRLIVPRNAQVLRASQSVRAQDIEAIVLSQALKDAGGKQADVKTELMTPISDQQFPVGALDWQTELMGKHLVPGGDRTYQVTARVDGKEVWRMPLRVRQKVYQTVVVAKRPIRRGQTIAAEDVTAVRRTLNASKEAGFTSSLNAIVGTLANRPIAQDEPINETMVRSAAAITEGSRVLVVYETPRLSMTVTGVAMVNGQIGSFIPVRNLQTGKVIYGIVQADDRVKVN